MEKTLCEECKKYDATKQTIGGHWICEDCKHKAENKEETEKK